MGAPVRAARRLPLLGYAVPFARDPLAFTMGLRDRGELVRVPIVGSAIWVVNDPELVRTVLTSSVYERGPQADRVRSFLGNGLVTSDGAVHKRNRRLVQPAFHRERISSYAAVMEQEASAMTAAWRDGEPIDVTAALMHLTLRVVGRTLFSSELATDVVDAVVSTVPVILDGVGRKSRNPLPALGQLPTRSNREFERALHRIRTTVDQEIARYRTEGVDKGDMASMLMLSVDADTGERLSDKEVRDEVITIFAAGTETTSNTVSWVLHVLGGRPDLEQRLQTEVDDVVGDRPATIADVPRLESIRRMVTESLRLYPQAWALMRAPIHDVQLGDTHLPAGTPLLLPLWAIHRDPAVYPDPDVFDPDRWLPELDSAGRRPSFVPFGGGRHICLGEAFAWTEAAIVIATIVRRWRLRPLPGHRVGMNSLSTIKPTQLRMTPGTRNPAPNTP